jgi:hypothetical protein
MSGSTDGREMENSLHEPQPLCGGGCVRNLCETVQQHSLLNKVYCAIVTIVQFSHCVCYATV